MLPFLSDDILITIDFAALGVVEDSLNDTDLRTVTLFIGLTNRTEDVVLNAIPIPLTPGLHLYGRVYQELRQQSTSLPLSTIGFFSVRDFY
jgi:hypothetical protein